MSKKAIILFTFSLLSLCLFSQKQKIQNQPYGDQRLYHFGLTVGLNFQDMILTNSGNIGENGERWFSEIPNYSAGFNVGIIGNMYLNPYMSLRFTPTIHFGTKSVLFKEERSEETYKTSVRSSYLNFPLDIKFNTRRLNNYRPYVLAGVYGSLDLGREKEKALLFKSMDYGFQFGIGCDFYLPIVKACPELRFYFGLADLLERDRSDLVDKDLLKYTESISKATSRMIVLTFNFE